MGLEMAGCYAETAPRPRRELPKRAESGGKRRPQRLLRRQEWESAGALPQPRPPFKVVPNQVRVPDQHINGHERSNWGPLGSAEHSIVTDQHGIERFVNEAGQTT